MQHVTGGDFDSLKVRMPWKEAASRSILPALMFAMIPSHAGMVVHGTVAFAAWAVCSTWMNSIAVGTVGPRGIRAGSVDLAWAEFGDPVLDGKRLRVTGPGGMHFHLPQACYRDADFVRYVTENAPQDHSLAVFLRSSEPPPMSRSTA
jgi:hypothetical protein